MTTGDIQIAVARADLILCQARDSPLLIAAMLIAAALIALAVFITLFWRD